MGTPYTQASPLQAPFFPVMAPQPGLEQPLRPQQLPGAPPVAVQPPDQAQLSYNFHIMQSPQSPQTLPGLQPVQMEPVHNLQSVPGFAHFQPAGSSPGVNPYVAPVMAVILPHYPTFASGFPSVYPPSVPSLLPPAPLTMAGFAPFQQPPFQTQIVPNAQTSPGPLLCSPRAPSSVGEEEEAAGPRALFSSSRSSSPLQLNLLQEELPKPSDGPSSSGLNLAESLHEQHANEVSARPPTTDTGPPHTHTHT